MRNVFVLQTQSWCQCQFQACPYQLKIVSFISNTCQKSAHTPRPRSLKSRNLSHLSNHRQNADTRIPIIKAVCCLTNTALVNPKRRRYIARHAVRVAELICPKPGKLIAPLTKWVKYISPRVFERVPHYCEAFLSRQGIGLKASAVIIFKVVYFPRCICLCVKFLVAVTAWEERAIIYTGITI